MSATKIQIRKGDDMHCHFRDGRILAGVGCFTESQFCRAVAMPNLVPLVLTARDVIIYRNAFRMLNPRLSPLMTIQINGQTTSQIVREAKNERAVAGKVYPQGVTTNSENGVSDFKCIYPALEEMQKVGMLLLLHGEDPWEKAVCLDRERLFLPTLLQISDDFPKLKIVLEHITTKDAVDFVLRLPGNVAATITVHHLLLTIDDVIGNLMQPHNFCKPIAKRPEDREALLEAATSGNPRFFFGSDSAPHLRDRKECAQGCAGVFSAPVAMQLLAQIFEARNALDRLENFVSVFGARFYSLPLNEQSIELIKEDWTVPKVYRIGFTKEDIIVPFMADQTLHWRVS